MAEEAAEADEDPTLREVKWGLPEGLKVLEKPTKLDDALLGMIIFMRWVAPHGWAVGKITNRSPTRSPPQRLASSRISTFAARGPTDGPTTC